MDITLFGSRKAGRALIAAFLITSFSCAYADIHLDKIKLPPGFKISVYCDQVRNAREMARSPKGTLFVGTRAKGGGRVYAVVDQDGDYKADKVYTIDQRLTMPTGVAFVDGSLYVAAVSRILRYDHIEDRLDNPPEPVVVDDTFPTHRHHGWKYLAQGPDGMLYTNIGAPCNICEPGDPFASIVRFNLDGSGRQIYARGVRNTVGFTWHPVTKQLWFTDNGRDMLGDNRPPDELNCAPKAGMHFGFPYIHGRDILDPQFGDDKKPGDFTPPVEELGPHVATLGLKFYTGDMFPPEYKNQIFIAEHGSWNRTVPIGYRITLVRLEGNKAKSYEVFAHGWLQKPRAWGRPVDLLILPDGSMLVSDDEAGAIYRITYEK